MQVFEQALDLTIESLQAMRIAGRRDAASLAAVKALTAAGRRPAHGLARRPGTAAPQAGADKPAGLAELRGRVLACELCPHLAATRKTVVFGAGNPRAELMFVGGAPDAGEDARGEPFVGEAGGLLTKIIAAMGYRREDVFLVHALKCRPDMPEGSGGERRPTSDEMATCLPHLRAQIALVKPRAIVALGEAAMAGLFGGARPFDALRGRWHDMDGIPVMATQHPDFLLQGEPLAEKRKVWEDMLAVLEFLEKPITSKQYAYFQRA